MYFSSKDATRQENEPNWSTPVVPSRMSAEKAKPLPNGNDVGTMPLTDDQIIAKYNTEHGAEIEVHVQLIVPLQRIDETDIRKAPIDRKNRRTSTDSNDDNKQKGAANVFLCQVVGCGKAFARVGDHKRHWLWSHSGTKPLYCSCGRRFMYQDSLLNHMKTHAKSSRLGRNQNEEDVAVTQHTACSQHVETPADKARTNCNVTECRENFIHQENLVRWNKIQNHTPMTGKEPIEACRRFNGSKNRRRPIKSNNHLGSKATTTKDIIFECIYCKIFFDGQKLLLAHWPHCLHRPRIDTLLGGPVIKYSTKRKPYRCTYSSCQRKFYERAAALRHRHYHKKCFYSCNLCGKRFLNLIAVQQHRAGHET